MNSERLASYEELIAPLFSDEHDRDAGFGLVNL